ncbi:MAG: tRNA 2-thiouridine(34) synthase MnmA [Dehalococcoidia bacterium]|nr:tRNA 2-thiouridine(34) synthase MnmA [Dehalococcoidia bacterium]
MTERVLVAMSGGVDSAVAAALLHQQGYEVVGVTLRLYTEPDETALRSGRTCCGIEDVGDARAAAQRIGIPHYVLNMEREFQRSVVDGFVGAYAQGRTPNPCLACNQHVKFSTLLDRALAMGVDRLATGHYARIERDGDVHRLHRAEDDAKDQSYVLYTLDQDALARTLFPLGGLKKTETRQVARDLGLPLADKPDSVDICFVPGGDYREVLRDRGVAFAPGPILGADGVEVGRHEGIANFTVGQRRGLGLAGPDRRFVTGIDASRQAVIVGDERGLLSRRVTASEPHWVAGPPEVGDVVEARVRYHAAPAVAQILQLDAQRLVVAFDDPVRAVAPGQAIVLYRGTEVMGGATIERGDA